MTKTIIVHTIGQYVELVEKWRMASFKRVNGKNFLMHKGKWISQDKWNELNPFPIYQPFNDKGVTPDKRANFRQKN